MTTLGNKLLSLRDKNVEFEPNSFINKLLNLKKNPGRPAVMQLSELFSLNAIAREIFLSEPMLLEIEGPLNICGDIHGQFTDLLRIFTLCGFPDVVNYLFLGDYVDRGKQSLETICLLFAYKIKFPTTFFLLRGNHECAAITKMYGFFDECKRRYNIKLWRSFTDTFDCLPVVATIEDQIFCCHGGLSPDLLNPNIRDLSELKSIIRGIQRPLDIPIRGLLCDLVWSDPWYPEIPSPQNFDSHKGWSANERGASYTFSPDIIDLFLSRFRFNLIVRAHQVVEDGYEFYANRSLVTVFSAPNYCGEFDNAGAIFCVTKLVNEETGEVEFEGSFKILKPDVSLTKWKVIR